jgi:hypothetical protein
MHWHRLALLLTALVMLGWGAWLLRTEGPSGVPFLMGCQVRRWTGLSCPGCGMTRAASAALNGNILEALRLNFLGVILLPLAVVGMLPEIAAWLSKKPLTWRLRPGQQVTRTLVVAILVFTALRNLPGWPLG